MPKKMKTRRGNNEGAIFQTKDGRWIGQVTIGYNENGKLKRKSYTGKTRSQVALKMAADVNTVLKNGYQAISNEKFEKLFMEWLLVFKRNTVTSRTFERILCNARCHVVPSLGEYKLEEITPQVIQKFINLLYDEELSLDTIKKNKQLIGQFFE